MSHAYKVSFNFWYLKNQRETEYKRKRKKKIRKERRKRAKKEKGAPFKKMSQRCYGNM